MNALPGNHFVRNLLTICAVIAAVLGASGVAEAGTPRPPVEETRAYVPNIDSEDEAKYAPIFLIEHAELPYNRIGTPSARLTKRGKEDVYVDPAKPTIYYKTDAFVSDGVEYTNHFYRVHFERSPFSLFPFNPGAGENVGAFVIVTMDSDGRPLFVNTVQSCGCYHAIVPTDSVTVFPPEWDSNVQEVYGEQLPGLLTIKESPATDGRLIVTIRGGSHRIGDVAWMSKNELLDRYETEAADVAPLEALQELSLGDGTTSFFHTEGRKRGLVKGAWKPWETLLFGIVAFDAHVGQDRAYGEKEKTGRRFYTTLRGWKKKESDMAHYADYLRYNGWQL